MEPSVVIYCVDQLIAMVAVLLSIFQVVLEVFGLISWVKLVEALLICQPFLFSNPLSSDEEEEQIGEGKGVLLILKNLDRTTSDFGHRRPLDFCQPLKLILFQEYHTLD